MPVYQLVHTTLYNFDEAVENLVLMCCITPWSCASQSLSFHQLITNPLYKKRTKSTDKFGNIVDQLSFNRPLQKVEVMSVSTVVVAKRGALQELADAPLWQELFKQQELEDILSQARAYSAGMFSSPLSLIETLNQLMAKLYREFHYDVVATTVDTSLSELFRIKRGVCQDFARVMIAVLQANGIDARYVSGYLFCGPLENNTARQAASHAWVSVYMPDTGWVDLDPTNNKWVDEDYITLAWGRDYVDVVPVKGMLSGDRRQRIKVSVTIEKQ